MSGFPLLTALATAAQPLTLSHTLPHFFLSLPGSLDLTGLAIAHSLYLSICPSLFLFPSLSISPHALGLANSLAPSLSGWGFYWVHPLRLESRGDTLGTLPWVELRRDLLVGSS